MTTLSCFLNPLSRARDQTSWILVRFIITESQWELPSLPLNFRVHNFCWKNINPTKNTGQLLRQGQPLGRVLDVWWLDFFFPADFFDSSGKEYSLSAQVLLLFFFFLKQKFSLYFFFFGHPMAYGIPWPGITTTATLDPQPAVPGQGLYLHPSAPKTWLIPLRHKERSQVYLL